MTKRESPTAEVANPSLKNATRLAVKLLVAGRRHKSKRAEIFITVKKKNTEE